MDIAPPTMQVGGVPCAEAMPRKEPLHWNSSGNWPWQLVFGYSYFFRLKKVWAARASGRLYEFHVLWWWLVHTWRVLRLCIGPGSRAVCPWGGPSGWGPSKAEPAAPYANAVAGPGP